MNFSKRYFVFTILLLMAFWSKLNTWSDEYAEVEAFRGGHLEDEVFYPLKARSVNEEGLLHLVIGEQEYGRADGVYMGDTMEPMVSDRLAQKLFGCRVVRRQEDTVLVRRSGKEYVFALDETQSGDDSVREPEGVAELHDEVAYLPLEVLCRLFGCSYSWDLSSYRAAIAEGYSMGKLPSRFDLRHEEGVSTVRDQGSESTCWAQAALTALESSLLPEEKLSFDVDHMAKNNHFGLAPSQGGEYSMAVAYLLSWTGPVEQGKTEAARHIQEVHFFQQDDLDDIKWAVYQTGGVSTSIYANVSNSNLSKSAYYNKRTNAYSYRGSKEPNHDVVIIGWDDNYSAGNFLEEVPGDGAFICQNSWGTGFGEQGIFYVSYYDTNIGNQAVAYAGIEATDNYDKIYQSDLCGWIGQVGYNKEKILAANVYTAKSREEIVSAGFYTLGRNTSYQVYLVKNYMGTSSLANRVELADGTLPQAGYYTIPFDRGVAVEPGERFAIVVALSTPGSVHPMAIEYRADERTANVDISDGEGYISNNGLDWENVENMVDGNLCLKAYSRYLPKEDE